MRKAKPSLLGTLLPPLFLAEGAAQGVAGAPHPPTYRPIESGSQVGDEHLGVDGLQVPGEVLAVKLLPQLAPFCNVTIRLLSTKSREKIKLTSEASQETPQSQHRALSSQLCHRLSHRPRVPQQPGPRQALGSCETPLVPGRIWLLTPGTFWCQSKAKLPKTLWCCKRMRIFLLETGMAKKGVFLGYILPPAFVCPALG